MFSLILNLIFLINIHNNTIIINDPATTTTTTTTVTTITIRNVFTWNNFKEKLTLLGYKFTQKGASFIREGRKEGNVLLNYALNTFYLRLCGVRHTVKDHSDSEKGNPLLSHMLLSD